ncbi:MAG TPA: hypothetical protein VHG33_11635 [Woeseiaceae bacterium]|nr:hypothetical protein [Woeseiaceae bacterium]
MEYHPDNPPDPRAWLALDEEERKRLIEQYYEREGGYGGSLEVHAKVHEIIETQLAERVTPVKAAFVRLRDNGLSRQDAIRAIGSVLATRIRRIEDPADLTSAPNRDYFSALEALTADRWHERRERQERRP